MTYRIAHVTNWTGSGGGSIQAKTLLEAWDSHPELEAWGIHASNLESPESFVTDEPGYPLMYPSKFADGVREVDPDILFVHGYSPQLNQTLRDLKEGDDPIDAVFVLRNGMNLFEHWAGGAGGEKMVDMVTGFGYFDAIVCPTRYAAERVMLHYGDDSPTIAYISNAIDRDEYVPSSYLTDGWLKVVTASRGAPNNYLLSPLLAAMRIIDSEDFPMKLDMYGTAGGGHGDALRSLASGFEDITVHGRVDHDVLKEQLEAADVVCVPSISHQAVPLVALEAMAAGNVVIGSFPEAREEEAIVRKPATHPPAWREALNEAYDDPDDAREWVRTGIERAAMYDVETVLHEGYWPLFEELL